MILKVDAVNEKSKTTRDNQVYWGIKADNIWYNLSVVEKPNQGDQFDVEIKDSTYQGRTYHWAKVNKKIEPKPERANGHLSFWQYADAMKIAHGVASELEPNDGQARAALVNTAMIALTNGKIDLPPGPGMDNEPEKPEDEAPF